MSEVSESGKIAAPIPSVLLERDQEAITGLSLPPLPKYFSLSPVASFTLAHLEYEQRGDGICRVPQRDFPLGNGEVPNIISREEWGAAPAQDGSDVTKYEGNLSEALRSVVVHHTSFSDMGPQALQSYQQTRMGANDLSYHFIIDSDGMIYEGRPINIMGSHAGQTSEANDLAEEARREISDQEEQKKAVDFARRLDPDFGAIGVALVGDFQWSDPTAEQLTSLKELLAYLKVTYDIPVKNIMGHSDVKENMVEAAGLTFVGEETECPGQNLTASLSGIIGGLPVDPATADLLSQEKGVAGIRFAFPPRRDSVESRLEWLAMAYQKALEIGDQEFAYHCQAQASLDASFIVSSGMDREPFREVASSLGIIFPKAKGIANRSYQAASKVLHIGKLYLADPKSATDKILANVAGEQDAIDWDEATATSEGEHLSSGMRQYRIEVDVTDDASRTERINIGRIIVVSPSQRVSVGYRVGEETFETASLGLDVLFTSSSYFAGYSEELRYPSMLSVAEGQPHNLFIDPNADGLVVFEGGGFTIVHADEINVVALLGETLGSKRSIFQSNLLIYKGENLVQAGSSSERGVRRLLVSFTDGSHGIVNVEEYVTLSEAALIAAKIPKIESAVNLDTGGGNVAGVMGDDGEILNLGAPRTNPFTLSMVYYKPSIYFESRCIRGYCPASR